jgi:hypothetical protein
VATIVVNERDTIQFVNVVGDDKKNAPTLLIQSGDWENDGSLEPGIVFDVVGEEAPILTANDARKLAKWLNRAADALDGTKNNDKKRKTRGHYETDDDDFDRYS